MASGELGFHLTTNLPEARGLRNAFSWSGERELERLHTELWSGALGQGDQSPIISVGHATP